VQRRVTKLIPEIKHLTYPERLRKLNLNTLIYRSKRNDRIQTFRILKGIDDLDKNMFFELDSRRVTRGHELKLIKPRVDTRTRQNSFSQRVINNWNALPNEAIECITVNSFKTQLSKAWIKSPFKFNPLGTQDG
jgi:hypothetical protein